MQCLVNVIHTGCEQAVRKSLQIASLLMFNRQELIHYGTLCGASAYPKLTFAAVSIAQVVQVLQLSVNIAKRVRSLHDNFPYTTDVQQEVICPHQWHDVSLQLVLLDKHSHCIHCVRDCLQAATPSFGF
jgi:hypothetical protein